MGQAFSNHKMTDICNSAMNLSAFAYGLFSALATNTSDDNIVISPFSIASALGLVLAGATDDGTCQQQLHNVLNVDSHEDLPILTKNLLSSTGPSVSLTSANGIWSNSLKDSYIETVQKTHHAKADKLPAKYDTIDSYISKETNGLIKDMLTGPIDPLTVAVLVNAVHFKGDWTEQFNKTFTDSGTFTTFDGEAKEAMFMRATRKMNFAMDVDLLDDATIVQLDYGKQNKMGRQEFAAFFILPAETGRCALNGVIERLVALSADSGNSFESVLDQMSSFSKAELYLPRFKMSYGTKSLVPALKSLGLKSCFEGEGMFMNMSDDKKVYLDDVLHKAVLEVNEEGTVAAAATAAIMMTRSLPRRPEVIRFNRPFIMLIYHMPSNTPLFVARVDNPQF